MSSKWIRLAVRFPQAGRDIEALYNGDGPVPERRVANAKVVKRHGEPARIEPREGSPDGITHWRYLE